MAVGVPCPACDTLVVVELWSAWAPAILAWVGTCSRCGTEVSVDAHAILLDEATSIRLPLPVIPEIPSPSARAWN